MLTPKNVETKLIKGVIINILLFTSPWVFGQQKTNLDTLSIMSETKNSANLISDSSKKYNLLKDKNRLVQSKDSLKSTKKIKLSGHLFFKNQMETIKPIGNISVGYEYGVLPFVSGDNYPSGGISSNGNVSFFLLNIPIELTYHYTSIKNVIGLNNYFRISYDADRYKEQLNQQMNLKNQIDKVNLNKLQLLQQKSLQNIEYLNYLQKHPNYKIPVDTTKPALNYSMSDSTSIPSYSNPLDTLNTKYTGVKSNNSFNRNDSISQELVKNKAKYDSISELIVKTKQQIEQIKNIQNNSEQLRNPYLSKVQQVLSRIKKFEIGLCHPSYSMFLVNNVPLQGINIEYFKNNNFIAFTYGTTINNLMFNNNTVQGAMESARNVYNYFDFSNLSAGRKIISIKGGVGSKDDSHIYVGFLAGKGRTDYLHPLPDGGANSVFFKESNVVMELDAKYKFSEKLNIDFIVGKSSMQTGDLNSENISKAVNEIFSDYRSNAFLVRVNTEIKKTNTKITLSTRWVDPYFRSFGIGFLRSDNLRYEIKAEQSISKKIKYTLAYRREEDNLLNLYNYKNTLQSVNNSLNIKLNRQINIRLIYVPLFRELKSEQIIIKDWNTISTVIVSYTPKPKKISSQFNALYSRYIISGDSININFENFTYTHNFLMKSGFKTGLNISWFKNNLSDTLGNDTYLSVLDVGYSTKKGSSVTIGGKMAYKQKTEPQYGFLFRGKIKIYKGLFGEIEAEKILIGDYYNSFVLWKIKSFPYYCSTRLTLNF